MVLDVTLFIKATALWMKIKNGLKFTKIIERRFENVKNMRKVDY